MDPLPAVPAAARCLCSAPLWYVRPLRIGQDGKFRCKRCGREFRESSHWSPPSALLLGGDKTGDDRFCERMIPVAERISPSTSASGRKQAEEASPGTER